MQNKTEYGLISEIQRKAIHIACIVFPLLYFYWLSREQMLIFLGILSTGFLTAEFIRYKTDWGKSLFTRFFSPLLREDEKTGGLTGATFLLLALTLTIALFSKIPAIAAGSVLILSDSMAAIVGKRFGKHRLFLKSVEGTVTFFVVTCCIFFVLFSGSRTVLLFVAIVVSFLEAAPVSLNDNITIPLSAGLLLQWLV